MKAFYLKDEKNADNTQTDIVLVWCLKETEIMNQVRRADGFIGFVDEIDNMNDHLNDLYNEDYFIF